MKTHVRLKYPSEVFEQGFVVVEYNWKEELEKKRIRRLNDEIEKAGCNEN